MSYDFSASVGFGLYIPDQKLVEKLDDDTPTGTELMRAGNGLSGDLTSYLCVEVTRTYGGSCRCDPPKRMFDEAKWRQFFTELAKELKVKDPQIGWWLCAEYS